MITFLPLSQIRSRLNTNCRSRGKTPPLFLDLIRSWKDKTLRDMTVGGGIQRVPQTNFNISVWTWTRVPHQPTNRMTQQHIWFNAWLFSQVVLSSLDTTERSEPRGKVRDRNQPGHDSHRPTWKHQTLKWRACWRRRWLQKSSLEEKGGATRQCVSSGWFRQLNWELDWSLPVPTAIGAELHINKPSLRSVQ